MLPLKANTAADRLPPVTLGLIIATGVTYLLSVRHGGGLFSGPDSQTILRYGLVPIRLIHPGMHTTAGTSPLPAWKTLFTAIFLHASLLHLAGNLLFLWIFGPTLEEALGSVRYLLLYVLGGVAGLGVQALLHAHSAAPTVGAAGAIAAVVGGYIVLFPRAKVLAFTFLPALVTVIEVPLAVVVSLFLVLQAVFALTHLTDPLGGGGVIAYLPYLGGAALGLLTIRALAQHDVG